MISAKEVLRSPGVATFAGSAIAAAAAFIINILMSRSVGPAGRGEVAWALQLSYILAPVLTLGLERYSLVHASSPLRSRPPRLWSAAVLITLATAVTIQGPLTMVALMAMTTGYTNLVRSQAISTLNFRSYAAWQLSYNSWLVASGLLLFLLESSSYAMWAAIYAIPAVLAFIMERRSNYPAIRPRESLKFLPGTINALLASRGERLLLPILSGSRELGLYMAVATSIEMVNWIGIGLNERAIADPSTQPTTRMAFLRHALALVASYTAASVPVALGTWIFVLPLLGGGFENASNLIVPVSAATIIWNVYRKLLAPIIASYPRLANAFESSVTVLLAIACLIFIPPFGALGAALACMVSYGVGTVICAAVTLVNIDKFALHTQSKASRGDGI